jgi:hypothetical protein
MGRRQMGRRQWTDGATDASDGERHGGGGFLERLRRDGVMLRLAGGEGGTRPLGVLAGQCGALLAFTLLHGACARGSPIISLATGPTSAHAPNSKQY